MEKKMTKKEVLKEMKKLENLTQEMLEYIENEIKLLEKKSIKSSEKRQDKNKDFKNILLEKMKKDKIYSTKELIALDENFKLFSSQKMTAIVKSLIEEGKIIKSYDKRVVYYSLV